MLWIQEDGQSVFADSLDNQSSNMAVFKALTACREANVL